MRRLFSRIAQTATFTIPTLTTLAAMMTIQSSNSSGSSPIDLAARDHARVFTLNVIVLAVVALATIGMSVWMWRSGNRVQDAIRADADARIAEAHKEGARANERSGVLEVHTKELELQVQQQTERAAIAERQLKEVNERLTWRTLSAEQVEGAVGTLMKFKGTKFNFSTVWDVEAVSLTEQLQDVLRRAGCVIAENEGHSPSFPLQYGVELAMPNGHKAGNALLAVLRSADLLVIERHDQMEGSAAALGILVGLRKSPP